MASKKERELEYLKKLHESHHGDWLTWEGVEKYRKLARGIVDDDGQFTGERRKLCFQMMNEYGITELEAINIINGCNAVDYVIKYHRIRYQIPLIVDESKGKSEAKDNNDE